MFRLLLFFLHLLYLLPRYSHYLITGKTNIFLSKALCAIGPAFVKFGQILATRPDIVGKKLAINLSMTHDQMPSFGPQKINAAFMRRYKELPFQKFLSFDYKPVAAASIAQVHKATKLDGKIVAVKILRPNIRASVKKNILLLYSVVYYLNKIFSKKLKRFRLTEVISMLEMNLTAETDLCMEAASALKLKLNLYSDEGVYVPAVDMHMTCEEIMVMEWIDGEPISSFDRSKHNTYKILTNLVNTFCNQAYRDGFFHADMHPGNVFIAENDDVILTDFGVMGKMESKTKFYTTEILRGFLTEDYALVAKMHFEAGYVEKKYSMLDFENACKKIGKQFVGKNFEDISIGSLFSSLLKLTNDFNMKTRLELLLIQKATVLLEAVASSVDPKINIWTLSYKWLSQNYMRYDKVITRKIKLFFNFCQNTYSTIFKKI